MTFRRTPLVVGLAALAATVPAAGAKAPSLKVVATVPLAKPLAGADTAQLRLSAAVGLTGVRISALGGSKRFITIRLASRSTRTVNVTRLLQDPKVRGLRILSAKRGVILKGGKRPKLLVKRAPVDPGPVPPPVDRTPPSGVGAIAATTTRSDINLTWPVANDNVGVTGYRVSIDGAAPVISGSPAYTASGLECGRAYSISVSAQDAVGNVGPPGVISATTLACPVIAAVGDIACNPMVTSGVLNFNGGIGTPGVSCRQKFVGDAVRAINPDAFLMLGDAQYDVASAPSLNGSYVPAFGDLLGRTYAVQGNHDFDAEVIANPGAAATGYFNYFGARARPAGQTYYSFDLGSWHVVVLNSNCSTNAVNAPSCASQTAWLQADLAATRQSCIAAAWHHPRWSSYPSSANNPYADNPALGPWVDALYAKGADLVLTGHAHHYERIGPVNPSEQADPVRGMTFWVVGTGGRDLRNPTSPRPNSVSRQFSTFGPLKLTLGTKSYTWAFVPAPGEPVPFSDAGTLPCRPKA